MLRSWEELGEDPLNPRQCQKAKPFLTPAGSDWLQRSPADSGGARTDTCLAKSLNLAALKEGSQLALNLTWDAIGCNSQAGGGVWGKRPSACSGCVTQLLGCSYTWAALGGGGGGKVASPDTRQSSLEPLGLHN